MTRYAITTLYPCRSDGIPEQGRRIDPGDKCEVGNREPSGLWPVQYPVRTGTRRAWLRSLEGLAAIFNQHDYASVPYTAPGYPRATIKSGGCGPTAMAMIVATMTAQYMDPVAMATMARCCGARVSGGTDMGLLAKRTAERYGLSVTATSALSELRAHLAAGGMAIANVAGRGMFSTGGHYVVIAGEEAGTLRILDPGYYAGKYGVKYPRRMAAVKVLGAGNKVVLRCAPATLDADCVGRLPRYYLFRA